MRMAIAAAVLVIGGMDVTVLAVVMVVLGRVLQRPCEGRTPQMPVRSGVGVAMDVATVAMGRGLVH
jgi:hypothetical protein